jgi:hypothetical protein
MAGGSHPHSVDPRLDSHGQFIWAKRAGGTGLDDARGGLVVLPGSDSGIALAGLTQATADFGPFILNGGGESGGGHGTLRQDFYVARLTSSGDFVWVASAQQGPASSQYLGRLVLDGPDSLVMCGSIKHNHSFSNSNMFLSPTFTFSDTADMAEQAFVARLNLAGEWTLAEKIVGAVEGTSRSSCGDIFPDGTGGYIVSGYSGSVSNDFPPLLYSASGTHPFIGWLCFKEDGSCEEPPSGTATSGMPDEAAAGIGVGVTLLVIVLVIYAMRYRGPGRQTRLIEAQITKAKAGKKHGGHVERA